MPLKLRPTGLGAGIDKDRPDYMVFSGGWAIGRIYQTRGGPDHLRWFWSLTVNPPMARSDRAATLEEAKAQLKKSWDAWKAWAELVEIGYRKRTCGLSAGRQTTIKIWVEYLAPEITRAGNFPMDITSVFEWFAQESAFAAETTNDQQQREVWLRLAAMWMSAACRHGESDGPAGADRQTPNNPPPAALTEQISGTQLA